MPLQNKGSKKSKLKRSMATRRPILSKEAVPKGKMKSSVCRFASSKVRTRDAA
jgi:hypothetical protein